MNRCLYCDKEAKFQLKNGVFCCSKSPNSCPIQKEKNSISQQGRKRTWNPGGGFKPGGVPWNKGRKGQQTAWNKGLKGSTYGYSLDPEKEKERKEKISKYAKSRNFGGYTKGSGRGKKGWYKGFFCDSSWELAFVIYCLEHGLDIKRNFEKRQYKYEGEIKNYIPDFSVNGVLTEIKGYKTPQWLAKIKDNSDIKVLYENDLKPILEYVITKYGKDFTRLYKKEGYPRRPGARS